MEDICLNHLVYEKGRCDFCDARCPRYVGVSELADVIHERSSKEIDDAIIDAHNRTLERIHNEYVSKRMDRTDKIVKEVDEFLSAMTEKQRCEYLKGLGFSFSEIPNSED